MKKRTLLLVCFVLLFVLPNIGSFIKWGGMPPGYGNFPALKVEDDPGFNLPFFIFCSAIALGVAVFLLFPGLFGFKKPALVTIPPVKVNFPSWFKPALVVTLISWFLMWARLNQNKYIADLDHYTFVPLWWGFILVLDGIVYKRNNGISLVSSRPNTMKLLGAVSCFSWFVFEYQNFFVLENWYYPNDKVFTNFGNIAWQLMSYTTVLPAIFEWYWLLKTFRKMRERYVNGPKLSFPKSVLYLFLGVGLSLSLFMAIFPYQLFWVLWLSLIPILIPAMSLSGMWTPFTEIKTKGDWSPILLIAIATLINGFFWEFWNFGSEWFHDDRPTNPNYWRYSVPYLDKFHIFSEMPILGYFGYLMFGIVCWTLWLTMSYLIGFDGNIEEKNPQA